MPFRHRNNSKDGPIAPEELRVQCDCRVYAIGDIHGRHDLLISLLSNILTDLETSKTERSCEIVFLGDYIDRGDDSRKVLETLMALSRDVSNATTLLRGNHEDALLNFMASPIECPDWLDYGAQQTLASYGLSLPSRSPNDTELVNLRDRLQDAMGEHLPFLKRLQTHRQNGDVIFAHAGLAPDDATTFENTEAMVWGHPSSVEDWPIEGKLLVHGHFDAPDPVHRPGRICVDTGAYYSGRLTAVRLDDQIGFISACA